MPKVNMKVTHTGKAECYNRGKPYTYAVSLRETKLYWINSGTGTKYRKRSGSIPNDDIWNPTQLLLDTVKPVAV